MSVYGNAGWAAGYGLRPAAPAYQPAMPAYNTVSYGVPTPTATSASSVPAIPVQSNANYAALASQAEAERQAQAQRAVQRQQATLSGYDQQMATSRRMGDQGYAQLASNYDKIAADAAATRERNMGRIDQYGNSMRQDLAIKNQQALAAASQSAIKRGLGNTTIQDSLVRGQNFDNTRQQLSLEEQLLQNRISTDSQLSGAYQGVLQNRAQGLNQQWNQNIQNNNQLGSQKLGYLGGIQEDMSGFNTVANLYTQLWQMENANKQAQLDRQLQMELQQSRNPAPANNSHIRLGMPRRLG